jgi:hypothetical protein
MTDLAERTTGTSLVEERTRPGSGGAPPRHHVPEAPQSAQPWPSNAKKWLAVLAVLTLLGVAGTIIGFARGNESTDATGYESTIATLTAERDDALASTGLIEADLTAQTQRAVAAEAARDDLVAQQAADDGTIATLTTERDDLVAQQAADDGTIATLTTDRDVLAAAVATEQARLAAIALERNALAKLFPMTFDVSILDADLVGTYDVTLTKAYCTGFTDCVTLPTVDELTIRETPEGWLALEMDGFVSAALYRIDGGLFAVADTTTAVPACGTTPRVARVAVSLFAGGITIQDDGTRTIDDLGATMFVEADAVTGCAAGLAFYGAELTLQP